MLQSVPGLGTARPAWSLTELQSVPGLGTARPARFLTVLQSVPGLGTASPAWFLTELQSVPGLSVLIYICLCEMYIYHKPPTSGSVRTKHISKNTSLAVFFPKTVF